MTAEFPYDDLERELAVAIETARHRLPRIFADDRSLATYLTGYVEAFMVRRGLAAESPPDQPINEAAPASEGNE